MKVAITSTGQTLDSPVDERFGRAPWILVVDLDTLAVEAIDNTASIQAGAGAGTQAAQAVAERGVEWLLTGHVGPNAQRALAAAGIKIGLGAGGTCRETLLRFKAGGFQPASGADVGGHW